MTIYPFLTLYLGQVFGRLLSPLMPEKCMDICLAPILLTYRIVFAIYLYTTVHREIHSETLYEHSDYEGPLFIAREILPEDLIALVLLGVSHGMLATRFMAKKPPKGEVYLRFQNKAGHLRSMARHCGLVVGLVISTVFIILYY